MDSILQQITDWLKEMLVSGIMGNLSGMFESVNNQVGEIATSVGMTPANFSPGVFAMVRNISESVIIPIAGLILTFIACYELIQMIIDHNNLANFETWIFFKWVFKTFVAVMLITNTFNITMAVFDVAQHVINASAGIIAGDTAIDAAALETMEDTLMAMDLGPLLGLFLQSLIVQVTMSALAIVIFVIVYYGLNALSNNMILCDRKRLKNPNGLILGTPGSGKSFSAKREITNAFLITADDIIICDPEAEYYPLVERLKGQVIKVSQNSTQYINPMDINLNYSEGDTPIALKSDFILSFCELIMGGKNGLEAVEKTLIDRAVISVYRSYLADPKPENMPVLGDLYNEIRKQPEKEAQRIASALELYVNGSLNLFNHRTNVDIHNRLVCFDIKELGTQLKKVGMLIIQDQVWNRVTLNRSEGKATRYYIDEFHLLLKEEQTAAYSVEIWKRFRKWGGIPTGITQNVKDLLTSREVSNVFENSDFVYMLNQAQGDREILAKQLNISQQQMTYVTHSDAGEGLIFYGNVILPFIDRFPQDTELYRVMTTKPGEVSA